MHDTVNAFVPGGITRIEGRAGGPLEGLTFAAKDLFDVAGQPTGGGNHDWARQNPVPARHRWAVGALLDAGAALVGKTITDEVSLGILGESAFDGTPVNVRAPGRVAGGSSSGSAAAVAAGLCDVALGTDTGGSVRVPASFCGLHGMRTTHGRVDRTGMMAQAPSADTIGWFGRDAASFARAAAVMLGEAIPDPAARDALPRRIVVAADAFGFADSDVAAALRPMVQRLAQVLRAEVREETMAPQGLSVWARTLRTLQPIEAWATLRDWIERDNPRFAFNVARGLVLATMVPEADRQWATLMRAEARARMHWLLPPGTILCLPTTPFPAPPRGRPLAEQVLWRDRITCLTALGGLSGVPQLNLPGATVTRPAEGGAPAATLPVGLSIVGPRGSDAMLAAVALAVDGGRGAGA